MTASYSLQHRRQAAVRVAAVAAVAVMAIAILVLAGWFSGTPIMVRFSATWVPMKANAAVAFLLLGVALLLLQPRERYGTARWGALACALIVLLIAGLTLAEYLFGWNLGIDELLVREAPTVPRAAFPGRIAPNVTLALVLLSLGVVLAMARRYRWVLASQLLALAAALIGLLGLVGYLYQARVLYRVEEYAAMPAHAATALLLVSIGLFCARPGYGLMALLTSDGPGGHNLRSLWPTLVLLAMGAGWLALVGVRFGQYEAPLAVALAITAVIVVYSGILLANSLTLERVEQQRQRAEDNLRRLNETLEQQVRDRTAALQASNEALRQSEQRFRLMIESIKDYAIILLDPSGRITSWNVGAERIKGYHADEILGKSFTVFYVPEDVAAGKPRYELEQALANGRYEDEGWRVRKDGSRFWASVIVTPLYTADGVHFGYVKITRDISERRRAEQQLQALNADLLRRTAELQASNRELESFSYTVAHDLRSPLRALDGYSKFLLDRYTDRLDAQGAEYLTRIRAAAQRMGRLIDDLLNLARIGRVAMEAQPVDLSALATDIVDDLRQRDPERRVEVTIAPGMVVQGDRGLLRVALSNLLSNAWKFTSKTANARITVGSRTEDGTPVYFVQDNGTGFNMAYADKLFLPFHRLHTEEEFPGTGIGLSIVQRVIERHGGQVWAEGKEGEGATFSFTVGEKRH